MWKRLMIICLVLIGTFSVGYAYYNLSLDAATTPFQLQKGQKVVLGKYNNKEVVWDIGNNTNDYVLMSSKPIEASFNLYASTSSFPVTTSPVAIGSRESMKLKDGHGSDGYCPVTPIKDKINQISLSTNDTFSLSRIPFMPDANEIKNGGSLGLTLNDRAYRNGVRYWTSGYFTGLYMGDASYLSSYYNVSQLPLNNVPITDRTVKDFDTNITISNNEGIQWSECRMTIYQEAHSIRPFAVLDKSKIVFATNTSYTDGAWHHYDIDTSNLNENNELNPNKLRVQSSLIASLQDIKYNHNSIQKIAKDKRITLTVNADTGTNTQISVLLYNDAGTDIQYYKMLEPTRNGSNDYNLDLTGVPVGKYRVAVINEEYDAASNLPVESSPISNDVPLEIVEPHKLTYTRTPQSGASAGMDYEFSKNVNAGQAVGKITVNPQGVMPLTYTIDANGDNSYQNFEIDGLNSNNESSANSLNVKIKSSAPDLVNGGLKAGTYQFCINSIDANGDPVTSTSDSKICTSFVVEKTNLTIAFNDSAMTTKSIANASSSWSETATATPSNGTKITYTKVGGDISMINIDPDTGAISYLGGNAFGKVKIRATVDDDPSSGNDNYNPAFVEKEIVIYREVDGNITPDPASSDTTVPTFSASDANVRTGGTIGKVQGTLGTPDTIGGSTTTYSYTIKPDPSSDGSMFQVNASTGMIKANANLGVGTYHFTIIVSDHWSSKEIPVNVNVGMAPAENLKFYQSPTSNTIITSKSAALTDTGVTVFATVKGSSNTNPVTYRIRDNSTNVVTVHPSSGAITINGVGTVVIVAEKTGSTGQANAIVELTFTVTAGSQEFIYTDVSGNELPKSGNAYDDYTEVYGPGKTFQLYTSGNPAGTNVTYALKAGSPTDVISVDPSGLVSILNATPDTPIGQVIVEATSHDPNGNYTDKTIELPIIITKANQTISFSGVTSAQNGRGTVTPIIIAQDISSNDGGVTLNDTNYYISVDASASGIAWTTNGIDIEYDYSGATAIEVPLEVTKAGNRNYNSATATGKIKILSPSESTLSVSQPGRIYYGDHFTIRSLQDDSSSANVKYTFTVDNTIFVSNPTVSGNMADFDALKGSSGTKINITVTRTADSEVTLSKVVTIEVLPKDINVIIDDKTKQKGEPNPPLTFQDFTSQLVSWNSVQDVIDMNDVVLSTTATTTSKAGSYPITGNPNTMNTTYPNYNFIFKEGKLMIDSNVDKDVDGDGKPDFNDPDGDGCPDLNIKWKDDSGNWVIIN